MIASRPRKVKARLMLGLVPEGSERQTGTPRRQGSVRAAGTSITSSQPGTPAKSPFPRGTHCCPPLLWEEAPQPPGKMLWGLKALEGEPGEPVPTPRLSRGHPTMWSKSLHRICLCSAAPHPGCACTGWRDAGSLQLGLPLTALTARQCARELLKGFWEVSNHRGSFVPAQ